MTRRQRAIALAAAAAASVVSAAHAQNERLVYKIEVSAAGSKSQGLRGMLYDANGREMTSGAPVSTPIGQFRWIECRRLWDSCGWWRVGPEAAASAHSVPNANILSYRIYRRDLRAGPSWRGELMARRPVTPPPRAVATAMGAFRWTSGRVGGARWNGWVPAGWPDIPLSGDPSGRR